jgi:predicted PurR-regulated permease PerM
LAAHLIIMRFGEHLRFTGSALKNWAVAQLQDSIAVGLIWLIGLWIIRVPFAPFWAFLAGVLQIIPNIGAVLGVVGPVLAAAIKFGDWEHPAYVLVPIWASIIAPIVLGFIIPFWGVLLAPPLLAIVFAYKRKVSGAQLGLPPQPSPNQDEARQLK